MPTRALVALVSKNRLQVFLEFSKMSHMMIDFLGLRRVRNDSAL